jgi:hypothetical protein
MAGRGYKISLESDVREGFALRYVCAKEGAE